MDPKSADALIKRIQQVTQEAENRKQIINLGAYAQLLKTMGVRRPRIYIIEATE